MDNKLDTYNADIIIEKNEINPKNGLVVYEDKTSLVAVYEEIKEENELEPKEKKIKKKKVFGIISAVFAAISLCSVMIVGFTTSINIFVTPIVSILSLLIGLVASPIAIIISVVFFIASLVLIIGATIFNIAPQIIGIIFAGIDQNKNKERTMVGEIGHATSLVSLIVALASNLIASLFSLILAIIPVIISVIFALAKLGGIFALVASFIKWIL